MEIYKKISTVETYKIRILLLRGTNNKRNKYEKHDAFMLMRMIKK